MPDAVVVAAGRSPIGRAGKGSLVGWRPDDLGALVVTKVLGFKATSAKLKDVIEKVLARMLEENTVILRGEKLFVP